MKQSISLYLLYIAASLSGTALALPSSPGGAGMGRGAGAVMDERVNSPRQGYEMGGPEGQSYMPGHARRPSNLRRPSAPAFIRHGGQAVQQGAAGPGIEFSATTRAQQNVISNAIRPPRTFADSGSHLFTPTGTPPLNIRRDSEHVDPKSARTPSPALYPLPETPPQQMSQHPDSRAGGSQLRPLVLSTASSSMLPYRQDSVAQGGLQGTPPMPVPNEQQQQLQQPMPPPANSHSHSAGPYLPQTIANPGYQRISVHQHVLSNIEPTPEELMSNPGACVVMLDCGDFYCTQCCKVFVNSHRH